MINILIRTSNRPLFFADCINSIKKQTYKNVNIIVSSDAKDTYCNHLSPIRVKNEPKKDHKIDTARHFPYNSYLNEMFKHCKPGYVLILDDDDMLSDRRSLEDIMTEAKDHKTVFWRVRVGDRIVPSSENWKYIVNRDISMIGFAFSTKWLPLLWIAPYKQADYRLALALDGLTRSFWINEVLTETQRREGDGMGLRKDKK